MKTKKSHKRHKLPKKTNVSKHNKVMKGGNYNADAIIEISSEIYKTIKDDLDSQFETIYKDLNIFPDVIGEFVTSINNEINSNKVQLLKLLEETERKRTSEIRQITDSQQIFIKAVEELESKLEKKLKDLETKQDKKNKENDENLILLTKEFIDLVEKINQVAAK